MARPKTTTNGVIMSALRRLWMRSPERAQALKDTGYMCTNCGVKQSKAKGKEQKIQVHHIIPVKQDKEWFPRVCEELREHFFVPPEELEPLCPDCHHSHHESEKENGTRN